MTIFCLQTATRRGDLVHLTWKAVHPNYVEFLETKECAKRTIQLSRDAQAILEGIRLEQNKIDYNAYVFEPKLLRVTLEWKIAREWGRAVRRSGIPHLRFHDLRHTAAQRMVDAKVDLSTVRRILGHKPLLTTQRYLHPGDEQQQLAVDTQAGGFGVYLPSAPTVPIKGKAVSTRIH